MGQVILKAIQLAFAILLLPFIYTLSINFYSEFPNLHFAHQKALLWGLIVYVLFHFFILVPSRMFDFGQNLIGEIFKFASFLSVWMKRIFPFYVLILTGLYYVWAYLLRKAGYELYFTMIFAFFYTMHLVLTAKGIYEDDESILKYKYILCFGIVYIISLLTISAALDWTKSGMDVKILFQETLDQGLAIYKQVFNFVTQTKY